MVIKIELKKEFTKKEYEEMDFVYEKTFTKKNEFTETDLDFKNCNKIIKKFPNSSALIKDKGVSIGQTWIVPTNKKIMTEFLENKIKEQEMILKSVKKVSLNNFDCIYIFYSGILKEYRRQGLSFKAIKRIFNQFLKFNKKVTLFAWAYSKAGENMAIKTAEEYNLLLIIKK